MSVLKYSNSSIIRPLSLKAVSFEGGNSAKLYYLSASDIWHDKSGGLF
jgi:hypothetical protein